MTHRDTDDDHVTTYQLEAATEVTLSIHVGTEVALAFDDGSGSTIEFRMTVSEFQKLVDVFLEMVTL